MPDTVEYLNEQGLVLVRSFGKTSIEDWTGSLQQVIELHESTGSKRVLVDVREQETTPSTWDIFKFGEGLPFNIQFAIVTSESTKNDQIFLETIGRNRAKLIRLFDDYEEALKWLNANA